MTLFLQYNVNNHIGDRDGVRHPWWPSILSVSESVLSKDLLNSEPPLCNSGYAPDLTPLIINFSMDYRGEHYKTGDETLNY